MGVVEAHEAGGVEDCVVQGGRASLSMGEGALLTTAQALVEDWDRLVRVLRVGGTVSPGWSSVFQA